MNKKKRIEKRKRIKKAKARARAARAIASSAELYSKQLQSSAAPFFKFFQKISKSTKEKCQKSDYPDKFS